MEEIKNLCYKGTRILLGNKKRDLINKMISILIGEGFTEIQIPAIQYKEVFKGKVGEENNNLMYSVIEPGGRDLCLAPEYTAVIQRLAMTELRKRKNLKVFYVLECFRGEKPQKGRYRQFTQLGVEVLNPTGTSGLVWQSWLPWIAKRLVEVVTSEYMCNKDVTRGLDYYKDGKGFEITCEQLGAQKQVCGGGEYDSGIGFAIGIDRLLLIK